MCIEKSTNLILWSLLEQYIVQIKLQNIFLKRFDNCLEENRFLCSSRQLSTRSTDYKPKSNNLVSLGHHYERH